MKRMVLLLLLLALADVAASAAYKIQLKDGKVINADESVLVREDLSYFTKNGVYYYLPSAQIDQAATERLNSGMDAEEAAPVRVQATSAKPAVIGEDQLEIIRRRSRLATDGQPRRSVAPEGGNSPGGNGMEAVPPGSGRDELQSRLNDLLQQQAGLEQDQNNLQTELSGLQDQWSQSAQQNQRDVLQAQIDSLTGQLTTVQDGLSSVQGQLRSTQDELNSMPIIVDMNKEK